MVTCNEYDSTAGNAVWRLSEFERSESQDEEICVVKFSAITTRSLAPSREGLSTRSASRRRAAAVALVVCGLAGVGMGPVPARAETRPFERSYDVPASFILEAETLAGRITVRRGADAVVRIRGQVKRRPSWGGVQLSESDLRGLQARPPVRRDGNSVRIERIADERLWKGAAIDFEIEVPSTAEVRIRTESGRVLVEDIRASVSAVTHSSAIDFRGVGGPVSARTGSGAIAIQLAGAGDVEVSSGSGSIRVEGATAALKARTQSSRIEIAGSPGGEWSVESGSGSIDLRVPDTAAFAVDATSRSGDIASDHPVVGGVSEKHRLFGSVRGGGPTLRIRTASSTIKVHR